MFACLLACFLAVVLQCLQGFAVICMGMGQFSSSLKPTDSQISLARRKGKELKRRRKRRRIGQVLKGKWRCGPGPMDGFGWRLSGSLFAARKVAAVQLEGEERTCGGEEGIWLDERGGPEARAVVPKQRDVECNTTVINMLLYLYHAAKRLPCFA
jgi:hypothetical protein